MSSYSSNVYLAEVVRVVDGDTVVLRVDLGLRVSTTVSVRIAGIDAPEVVGAEREAGIRAKEQLEWILRMAGYQCRVAFEKGKSFDRWIGHLSVADPEHVAGLNVAALMVDSGHARWSTP